MSASYKKKKYVPKGKYTKKPYVPKATKTYVKKALKENKEDNWVLIDNSAQLISSDAPFLAQWSQIVPGSTVNAREGDRIEPTRMSMRYSVECPVTTSQMRFILFQWRPDTLLDGPNAAKILQIPTGTSAYLSPYVTEAIDRSKFVVLKDKMFHNYTGASNCTFTSSLNITKFNNKYIHYNTGATTGKNQIFLLAISNKLAASTAETPYFNKIVYLHWKDTA